MGWSRSIVFFTALAMATSSFPAGYAANPQAPQARPVPASSRAMGAAGILRRGVTDLFPGAVMLGWPDFRQAVVGRQFRYRLVGTEVVVERPTEVFMADGTYVLNRDRSIGYGSYSIADGLVSIAGTGGFLGLGNLRIFFRHEGRVFTTGAARGAEVYELVPVS